MIAAEINKIPLLLLEELENSVHPRLLQNLLTAIVQLAGDTKVLITSHSPYLIKYLEPTKMKFGIPTELGVADFRSLKPNKVATIKITYSYIRRRRHGPDILRRPVGILSESFFYSRSFM